MLHNVRSLNSICKSICLAWCFAHCRTSVRILKKLAIPQNRLVLCNQVLMQCNLWWFRLILKCGCVFYSFNFLFFFLFLFVASYYINLKWLVTSQLDVQMATMKKAHQNQNEKHFNFCLAKFPLLSMCNHFYALYFYVSNEFEYSMRSSNR